MHDTMPRCSAPFDTAWYEIWTFQERVEKIMVFRYLKYSSSLQPRKVKLIISKSPVASGTSLTVYYELQYSISTVLIVVYLQETRHRTAQTPTAHGGLIMTVYSYTVPLEMLPLPNGNVTFHNNIPLQQCQLGGLHDQSPRRCSQRFLSQGIRTKGANRTSRIILRSRLC